MKDRIYIKQWLKLKPERKSNITDSYYLRLANKIKKEISPKNTFLFRNYLGEEDYNLMFCFLSSYFEDVISGVNIWKTFVKKHNELYGKKLPFYNTEEYFDDEINIQDVQLLIWYFINSYVEDMVISPFNDFIKTTATEVMGVFEKEYEYAPENLVLKKHYHINKTEEDYYKIRSVIDKILYQTWLFYPNTGLKLDIREKEIIEENKKEGNVMSYLQENRDISVHNDKTTLLNMKGNEWLAEVLGEKHPLYKDILDITQKIKGFFYYKKQDGRYIYLEHIATGKKFNLLKSTYDTHYELIVKNTVLYIGLVKWQKEWWFSGITFINEYSAEIIKEQKNNLHAKRELDFLDYDKDVLIDNLKNQFDVFLKFNNGSPVKFLSASEINNFLSEYFSFFNNSLKLSEKEEKKSKNKIKNKGYSFDKDDMDFLEDSENALIFFNEKSGIELASDINSAFPSKENPYFVEEESNENIAFLIFSDNFSKELVLYCINNFKEKLSYFKSNPGKLYLKDLDFLMRFYKNENYASKPSITLI